MSLTAFMAQNAVQEENIKFVASKRFIDEKTKEPIEWEIKAIDSQRDEELRKSCTQRLEIKGKKGQYTKDTDFDKYVGKIVQLRSPMYEIGEKLCNKCAGDLYYMLGKVNIGLMCSRPAETLKRLGMKKFHDSTIHSTVIDVDDMLF